MVVNLSKEMVDEGKGEGENTGEVPSEDKVPVVSLSARETRGVDIQP